MGLFSVWRNRRGYFDGELKKTEYFKPSQKHLIYDLPDIIEALQRDDLKAYRKLRWRLSRQRLLDDYGRRLWNKNSGTVLRVLVRIIILLLAIAMAEGIFRK